MSLPCEKLKCVSIVCGIGPPDIGMRGANFINWVGFTFGWRYSPAIFLRWFFQREPAGRLEWSDEKRLELLQQQVSRSSATAHKKDLEVMMDEDILRLYLRSTRESFAQGFDGMVQDGRVICMDWGFRIEDIRPDLPVQLWYGKHDTHVPLNHGIQIAARLGGRASLRVEDETHASISQNWKEEVLEDLIKSM
jgi:pimeloyl-ACP methyl ester carboxylesterase